MDTDFLWIKGWHENGCFVVKDSVVCPRCMTVNNKGSSIPYPFNWPYCNRQPHLVTRNRLLALKSRVPRTRTWALVFTCTKKVVSLSMLEERVVCLLSYSLCRTQLTDFTIESVGVMRQGSIKDQCLIESSLHLRSSGNAYNDWTADDPDVTFVNTEHLCSRHLYGQPNWVATHRKTTPWYEKFRGSVSWHYFIWIQVEYLPVENCREGKLTIELYFGWDQNPIGSEHTHSWRHVCW